MTSSASRAPGDLDASARAARLFTPRRVAIVGASDRSAWSRLVHEALRRSGIVVELVNPRAQVVHGVATVPTLTAIDGPVDLAYVMTPAAAVLDTVVESGQAKIPSLIVLSAGFGESGASGRGLERAIGETVRAQGQTMLGPNTLGYVNFTTNTFLYPAGNGLRDVSPGSVALVTQSGALGGMMTGYAAAHAIGISFLCATGNEADLTVSDIIDYAVDDPATKVIGVFAEAIRNPAGLRRAARRALEAGKPIVMLKAGRSELAARTAATHTGSIVGDDAVVDAVLAQDGIIRVDSLEVLVGTAGVLAKVGPTPVRGLTVAAISGGVCDLAADGCDRLGIPLPQFRDDTRARLSEVLPDFTGAHNPLDLTGAIVRHPRLLADVLTTIADDGQADMVLCQENLGKRSRPTESIINGAKAMHEAAIPAYLISATGEGLTEQQKQSLAEFDIPYLGGGLEIILSGLARQRWWAQQRRHALAQPTTAPRPRPQVEPGRGKWSEARTSDLLSSWSVPLVPRRVVRSAAAAVAAFEEFGGPVVLKIVSPDILHKTEIGGVRLDVTDTASVAAAYEAIVDSASRLRPDAVIDGVLVSPMRPPALELLVGVTTDPQWGQVLTVGLGGTWTEIFKDVSTRLLPVAAGDVRTMLTSLRSAPLLLGARNSRPADLDALSEVIAHIGALAVACGPALSAIEVNPIRVDGSQIEVLDAVALWADEPLAAAL
ncbi:acetate--CoA ligase family protein [Acrocarpospora catenulata]|uniref:acetate--CoA ligase family protein n=1 Tax=Acrocarpospora catenulata TaxID=2836182 RepID=UPI001BDA9F0F|nr:acetate--CoA ligase family protein [Acrocarpospora catenulata]